MGIVVLQQSMLTGLVDMSDSLIVSYMLSVNTLDCLIESVRTDLVNLRSADDPEEARQVKQQSSGGKVSIFQAC